MQRINHILPEAVKFRTAEPSPFEPNVPEMTVLFPTREAWQEFTIAHPECPRIAYCKYGCGGVGYMRRDVELGHPLFGKAVTCQCARAKTAMGDAERLEVYRATLSPTEQGWTLETWIGTDKDALKIAYQAAAQGWGLFCFYGDVGVGKSGLLAGIVNAHLDRRQQAVYKVATQMLDELRDAYDTKTFEEEMNALRGVKVLAVDEMWRFSATEWAREKVFQLLDYRSRYWDRLLTVIATNESPNVKDPLWSRFTNGQTAKMVRVTGRDLRPMAG